MRRSQLYRQTARHHAAWAGGLAFATISVGGETYVAYAQHEAWTLALMLVLFTVFLVLILDNLKLFRHFRNLARRAAADEWRYAHRPAIAYSNHRPTHKHQHN